MHRRARPATPPAASCSWPSGSGRWRCAALEAAFRPLGADPLAERLPGEAGALGGALGRVVAHASAERLAGDRRILARIRALVPRLVPEPALPIAVIEGDQATSRDAERIRAAGAPAIQVTTGKGCHLDAAMVARALDRLDPPAGALLLIENVGNLVCPAGFDLGEAHKVVLCSLAEGDDKPLEYPTIFAAASLLLVTKIDLAPHLDADPAALIANARRIRPNIAAIRLSARTGEGIDRWLAWIEAARALRAAAE